MNDSGKSQSSNSSPLKNSKPTASGDGLQQAIQYNEEGNKLLESGNYQDAIKWFEKAIETRQDIALSHFYKGTALEFLGEDEKAVESFNIAIPLDKNLVEAYLGKGACLLRLLKEEVYQNGIEFTDVESKKSTILECFNTVIKINPKTAIAYRHKGDLYQFLGMSKEAITSYDQALILKRTDFYPWVQKGICLQSQEKYNEANKCFEIAIALEPQNPFAQRAKKTLISLCAEKKFELSEEEAKNALEEIHIGSVKLYSSKSVEDCDPNKRGSFRMNRDSEENLSKSLENKSVDQFNINAGMADVHDLSQKISWKHQMEESGKERVPVQIDMSGKSNRSLHEESKKFDRSANNNRNQPEDQYNFNYGLSKDVYDNSYQKSWENQLKESQEDQISRQNKENYKQDENELEKSQLSLSWSKEHQEEQKVAQDQRHLDFNSSWNNEYEDSGASIHIKQVNQPRLLKEASDNRNELFVVNRDSSRSDLSTQSLHSSYDPNNMNGDLKGSLSSQYRGGDPFINYEKMEESRDPSLIKKAEMSGSGIPTKRGDNKINSHADSIAGSNISKIKERMESMQTNLREHLAVTEGINKIFEQKINRVQDSVEEKEMRNLENEYQLELSKIKDNNIKLCRKIDFYMGPRWNEITKKQGWEDQEIQKSLKYLESFSSVIASACKISDAIVSQKVMLEKIEDCADVLSTLVSLNMLSSDVREIESYLSSQEVREKAQKMLDLDSELGGIEIFARDIAQSVLSNPKVRENLQKKQDSSIDEYFQEKQNSLIKFCKGLQDSEDFNPTLHSSKYEAHVRRMAYRDANDLLEGLISPQGDDGNDSNYWTTMLTSQYDVK